ncbi:D-alanyl-D-alanine carboxypeptidase/D-alanyl-D-alanine endopeptidase [Ferribacterium limneticum]|uniref:D-alanyl-D-alanine carboxypeptidase/D-alanyl-D-alanine endopeptidase n=1 Tax=Ferribacterium limneticum TaxID=76259 RepID=UPI001CFC1D8F|nr:D-alanyl-D-alanine carboxypeptidase/D-alanyl-D-alanine-endopeptidase [Ferribacterium limneticum]UCV28939.1 D-alanyl-D-alanine carboxypeptidase/D-alanyl-D-alanine-endopeptidase [Ferribacterium limneticum]UCV32857.1 D-alanyl-D-alanine carboxypeptidase/D-alanyl-D-alanine-endopeptidase [Ferribacterium limneticum]
MFAKILATLALAGLSLTAQADGLPPNVLKALKAAQIPAANVAVVVHPVDATAPLVAHNARQSMNPASVMKLLTTYAALDLLGPAYTWKTTAWTETAPVDGLLSGNVYLRGSGDPRFAIEHLWGLLRQLRVRGIQQIAGDVVLDRTAFNVPSLDPGAFDDKPMRPYNVGPDGLLLNFRALRFTLLPDNGKPRVLMETPSEGLRVDNLLRAGNGDCGSNWKDFINVRLIPENTGNRLEFSGTYSVLCGEKALNLSPLPADAQASGLIRALWQELGGKLSGQVRAGSVPIGAKLLAQHESAPLADAVRDINKFSNNVMARQVFLTLGNDAAPATAERSKQRIADWLVARNLRFDELVLDNGSGLSRLERISADSLNRLLLDAWKNPVMPEFVSSMPIVGIDGTMKKRLNASDATGRAHIKTGTLDGVKTASGYALDALGRRYAFTFLINHPRAQAGSAAIDALLVWVAQRRVGEKAPVLENE